MKKNFLEDSIGYFAVKCIALSVRFLPISIGLWFGRRLGDIVYIINNKRRRIGYLNLKAAAYFGSGLGARGSGLKHIVRETFQNLGQNFIEMFYFPKMDAKWMDRYIQSEGTQRIDEALDRGKGLIFLTAHFGNWELGSQFIAIKKFPIDVLAREQKHSKLNQILNRYRQSLGCRVVAKGMAVREIIKSLRANRAVGMLADQDSGRQGMFVPFFGRPVSTAQGPFRIAKDSDSVILPSFIIRLQGPYHRLIIGKPIYTQLEFNALLESYVERYPAQWLWVHRRWKSTPVKSVIVLDDGKAGHLNQALAVVKIIRGHQSPVTSHQLEIRSKIIKVDRRKPLKDYLNLYADIVISCGFSTSRLNLLLSKENNAKSIVIMKPSLVSINRFYLAIIPKHDNPKPGPNVVETLGAPNLIDEAEMRQGIENLLRVLGSGFWAQGAGLKIGLLIGGDTKEYKLSADSINILLDGLVKVVADLDAKIFATTSRRTSKEAELKVKERLENQPGCSLLIIANEKNVEGAVPGILGLCDIVVVSPESISMVSEAASSGKYVAVFEDSDFKRKKQRRFLNNLSQEGFIYLTKIDKICDTIKNIWQEKPPVKVLKDSSLIKEAVTKLL